MFLIRVFINVVKLHDYFSDVIRSIIGSLIWISVIVTWVTIFQLKRADWGATGDYISFMIPRGEP